MASAETTRRWITWTVIGIALVTLAGFAAL